MKVLLIIEGNPKSWLQPLLAEYDAYVEADRSALYLLQVGYPVDLVVGGFDSSSSEGQEEVSVKAKEYVRSPVEKGDIDTQLGILEIFEHYPQAEVALIGATDGRLDYLSADLWLDLKPHFRPFAHQFIIRDHQNHSTYYSPGEHIARQVPNMECLAYCCLTPVLAPALKGSKYVLKGKAVKYPTPYTSNESFSDAAEFSFSNGMIVVTRSKD